MAFACWSFEPRVKQKIRPFVPWVHQESVFLAMDEAVDRSEAEEISIDVILDKSRAQGGTFGYFNQEEVQDGGNVYSSPEP